MTRTQRRFAQVTLGLAGMLLAFATLATLAGCGASAGGMPTPVIPAPTTLRADLHFGYWAGDPLYMAEQCDHVNTWWARADGAVAWHLAIAAQLQAARGCGIKNIVLHLDTEDPAELRFQLGKLSEGGYFAGWDSFTVYRLDEPNASAGGSLSEQEVATRVTRIRQAMFDVPGLLGTKVGVFYNCDDAGRPGITSFDFVGCFRYGSDGCAKLEADYAELRAKKTSAARLWLIPGGAFINGKEGRQDPACWSSYAHRNADVWGLIPFMWQGGADPHNDIKGIRDQADMRKLYCETGRVVLHPTEVARCSA